MILTQVFKSLAGAQKRCAFENAHSKSHRYSIVWLVRDVETDKPDVRKDHADMTWKLRKSKR